MVIESRHCIAMTNHTHKKLRRSHDPKGNTILCGSDLRRLGDELQKAKFHHSQQLVTLTRYEDSVKKLYKKPEVDRYLDSVRQERRCPPGCLGAPR